jgi:DTW domain-containing protein YfiP
VPRRNNVGLRCRRCRLHGSLCLCPLLPRVETRTRLVLVIHRAEDRRSSNTGRLAAECLVNSEVIVRGDAGRPSAPLVFPEGSRPLLLFPHDDAAPLAPIAGDDRPVTLIVPDGNWRQASKVRQRVPGLHRVPCVCLPAGAPSIYRLRAEAHPHALATIEAIARALGVLEGEGARLALERVFRTMVERTLWSRGDLDDDQVTGGIPEGAMRHDPRSGSAARGATLGRGGC